MFGSGLSFDGVRSYVDGAIISLGATYTLEFWVYSDGFLQNPTAGVVAVGRGGKDPKDKDTLLSAWGVHFLEGQLCSSVSRGGDLDLWKIEPYNRKTFARGWHHVAVCDDGAQRQYFRDGHLTATHTNTLRHQGDDMEVALGRLGARDNSKDYFRGLLRDVRVWNVARTGAEVNASQRAKLSGSEPGLVLYWPLDEGQGNVVANLCQRYRASRAHACDWTTVDDYAQLVQSDVGLMAFSKEWEEMKQAVSDGADVNHVCISSDMLYPALFWAAYHDQPEAFSWLAHRGADVKQRDKHGKTALHVAAKYGSPGCVRVLLLEGVDPKVSDDAGREPAALTAADLKSHRVRAVDTTQLEETARVFAHWANIKPAIDNGTLKQLAASGSAEVKAEAVAFGAILDKPSAAAAHHKTEKHEDKKNESKEVDVFLSYSWSNKAYVRALAEELRRRGIRVWLDAGQLGAGDELFEAIDSGLRSCAVVVAAVSHAYGKSLNCRREISLASDLSKPLLPLLVDLAGKDYPPHGPMGPLLTGKLYIDMKDPAALDSLLNGLTKYVKHKFETAGASRSQMLLPKVDAGANEEKGIGSGGEGSSFSLDNTRALVFDGVTSVVDGGAAVPKLAQSTLEMHLYSDGFRQDNFVGLILCGGQRNETSWGLAVVEGQVVSIVSDGTHADVWKIEAYNRTNYRAGWHHLALTDDGTTRTFYRNGVRVGSTVTKAGLKNSGREQLLIGRHKDTFRGLLRDVRVWDRCRNAGDVERLRHTFLAGNEEGLLHYWPMVEGGGELLWDKRARFSCAYAASASTWSLPKDFQHRMQQDVGVIAFSEQWEEVKEAVIRGCDMTKITYGSKMAYPPLFWAAYYDKPAMFSWLAHHGADVNAVDRHHKTALHVAAKYGSPGCVRVLLLEGVDPSVKDDQNREPASLTEGVVQGKTIFRGREVEAKSLESVARVFVFWPQVRAVIESSLGGVAQLKALAQDAAVSQDLRDEAKAYLDIVDTKEQAQKHASVSTAGANLDVFMSYCWADKDVVRPLADKLRDRGFRVWLDAGQMGAGDALFEAIDKGIRSCKVVVASISKAYGRSLNCRREVSLTNDVGKPILPILVEEAVAWPPVGPMGPLLSGKIYVDMTKSANFNDLVEGISKHAKLPGSGARRGSALGSGNSSPTTPTGSGVFDFPDIKSSLAHIEQMMKKFDERQTALETRVSGLADTVAKLSNSSAMRPLSPRPAGAGSAVPPKPSSPAPAKSPLKQAPKH